MKVTTSSYKRLFILIVLLSVNFFFPATISFAQVPQAFNYQAVARSAGGSLLVNQAATVQYTIHDVSATGAILYQERHNIATNQFGLFSTGVGNGTVIAGVFSTINWSVNSKYLQVEIDLGGGFADMGTSQLLSVPYALNSLNTSGISGAIGYISKFNTSNTIVNSVMYESILGFVGIGTTSPIATLDIVDNGGGSAGIRVFKTGTGENAYFIKNNPTSSTVNVYMSYDNDNGQATLESHAIGNGIAGLFVADANGVGLQAQSIGTGPAASVYSTGSGFAFVATSYGTGTTSSFSHFGSGTVGLFSANSGTAIEAYTTTGLYSLYDECNGQIGTGFFSVCNNGSASWGVAGVSNDGIGGYFSTTTGTAGYFNGNIAGTGTFTYTSDAKLKKNIEPLSEVLNKIMQLKPSTYEYRVGEFGSMTLSAGKHIGVIAQDLQYVFPELVKQEQYSGVKDRKTGKLTGGVDYLSVNYNELIPVLIKGIQELKAEVESLKSELNK